LECTAVSWNDGASDQLVANRMSGPEFERQRVITNKQNAARTGTEQPEDLQRKYPIIRKEAEIKSRFQEDPALKTSLQVYFEKALESLEKQGKLILKQSHLEAIIDYVTTLPEILQKAFSSDIIRQGFIESGYIDANCLRSPDFYQMIRGTTRRVIELEEMENLKKKFVALMHQQLAYGQVEDPKLEAAGITPDRDKDGNIIRRDAPLSQESRHRAKTTSHDAQKAQREKIFADIEKDNARKQNVENVTRHRILEAAEECKECIRYAHMCRTNEYIADLADATIEDFEGWTTNSNGWTTVSIKVELYKAFIHVREFTTSTKASSYGKWPKKGALEDAKKNEDCLLLRAFKLKTKAILLQPTSVDLTADESPGYDERLSVPPTLLVDGNFQYEKHNINPEWVQQVRETYHGIHGDWNAAKIQELKKDTDDLFDILKRANEAIRHGPGCKHPEPLGLGILANEPAPRLRCHAHAKLDEA